MKKSNDPFRFQKLVISARYWLLGMAEHDPGYFRVIEAMELGLNHHDGLRNGGDHEFIHQIGIFHHLRTLHKHLKNPITVYILVFLHDAIEDKNHKTGKFIAPSEILEKFGQEIHDKVLKLSKEILGQKNPGYSLQTIFEDEDCGAAKGGDRVDNVSSMVGVFKRARLERYVRETADEFLPMFKLARRLFPHQEAVYENMKLELVNQLTLISHILDGYVPEDASIPK